MSAGQNQRRIGPPHKRGIILNARGDASRDHMGHVMPPQQGVAQEAGQVSSGKFEWYFFIFPEQFALLNLQARNRQRDQLFYRALIGGKRRRWHGSVGGAVGIGNDVDDGMLE